MSWDLNFLLQILRVKLQKCYFLPQNLIKTCHGKAYCNTITVACYCHIVLINIILSMLLSYHLYYYHNFITIIIFFILLSYCLYYYHNFITFIIVSILLSYSHYCYHTVIQSYLHTIIILS